MSNTNRMAIWILAVMILVPICLTILFAILGLLCKSCCQERSDTHGEITIDLLCEICCQGRSDEDGLFCMRCCCQGRSQDEIIYNDYRSHNFPSNVDYDVESQRTQRSVNQTVQSQNTERRNVNYYIESERTQRNVNPIVLSQNREQRNVNYNTESERKTQKSLNQAVQSQNRELRNVNYDFASQRRVASNSETEHFKSAQKIYLETSSTGYPKLDLHNYNLNTAMAVFKVFLQISVAEYRRNNHSRSTRFTHVITGRGLHSPNGIPIIKPAVENYLKAHDYTYNWSNPGMVRIDLLPFKEQN